MSFLLRNATLADGSMVDVEIDGRQIAAVAPAGSDARPRATGDVELAGRLLLPAPVEPHAHLDKALTADLVANPRGDLVGAIEAWLAHRPTIDHGDYVARATAAARLSATNGCTALRTHVDLGIDVGTAGVEALLDVKAALVGRIELQLVGLVAGITGGEAGSANEQLAVLRDGLDMGLDVVGGVPHIEHDPARAIDLLLDLAGQYRRPIDLHADENLDAGASDLETLARRVLDTGFERGVVASHCVALGVKAPADQDRIAESVAEAGIAVIALPQTNLYLQARGIESAQPRGLTGLAALARAGVTVAGGGDNLRDPFCPVGRGDPLETAALLVMAGHLTPGRAYGSVSSSARRAMGLAPVTVEPGSPAELLALPAASIGDAVAAGPADRVVIHQGRIVSGHSGVAERSQPTNATPSASS